MVLPLFIFTHHQVKLLLTYLSILRLSYENTLFRVA